MCSKHESLGKEADIKYGPWGETFVLIKVNGMGSAIKSEAYLPGRVNNLS